jgi:hypothetical protein
MEMVSHQAISVQSALKLVFPFIKVIKVILTVVVRQENRLPVMSTMNDVVGMIRNYESSDSRHEQTITYSFLMNNELNKSVPLYFLKCEYVKGVPKDSPKIP